MSRKKILFTLEKVEQMHQRYLQGKNDAAIAKELDMPFHQVRKWRMSNGLPVHSDTGSGNGPVSFRTCIPPEKYALLLSFLSMVDNKGIVPTLEVVRGGD
jgi:hypothetical protein